MGASILTARNLSKVVPSAEGELTILHELSLELNPVSYTHLTLPTKA